MLQQTKMEVTRCRRVEPGGEEGSCFVAKSMEIMTHMWCNWTPETRRLLLSLHVLETGYPEALKCQLGPMTWHRLQLREKIALYTCLQKAASTDSRWPNCGCTPREGAYTRDTSYCCPLKGRWCGRQWLLPWWNGQWSALSKTRMTDTGRCKLGSTHLRCPFWPWTPETVGTKKTKRLYHF